MVLICKFNLSHYCIHPLSNILIPFQIFSLPLYKIYLYKNKRSTDGSLPQNFKLTYSFELRKTLSSVSSSWNLESRSIILSPPTNAKTCHQRFATCNSNVIIYLNKNNSLNLRDMVNMTQLTGRPKYLEKTLDLLSRKLCILMGISKIKFCESLQRSLPHLPPSLLPPPTLLPSLFFLPAPTPSVYLLSRSFACLPLCPSFFGSLSMQRDQCIYSTDPNK